jgi:acid phosphatase (class A)
LFAAAIGPAYSPGKFPELEALCKDVEAESRAEADIAKNTWKRLRPAIAEPARFTNPSDPETSFSYPGSHATRGTVLALVLAEIFPSRRAEILQKGRDIGWVRVEAGAHTPIDIFAGRVLGQALAQAFLRDPKFQADLAAVKGEVAAVQ